MSSLDSPVLSPGLIHELRLIAELSARVGGATLLHWRDKFEAHEKAPSDLVTDADVASQNAIRRLIDEQRPEDRFIGEEQAEQTLPPPSDGRVCWVVDPLDGTANYVHGFPCYATSVGAVIDGRLVAGAVFDPLRNEMFSASSGGGATLNGQPMGVSEATELVDSLVAMSLPPRFDLKTRDLDSFLNVVRCCRAMRRTGSAALNLVYVAAGRLDAHWAHSIKPWDAAAGVLIASEAGARVTDSDGAAYDIWAAHYLIAATDSLHAQLLDSLA